MKGLLRSMLFGGGWTLAATALALVAWPDFFPLTPAEIWLYGTFCALASAAAFWAATRLPATASWLIAIVGWIVGFHVAPIIVGTFRIVALMASQ